MIEFLPWILFTISLVINLFLYKLSAKVNKIEEVVVNIDKRVMPKQEINEMIDYKILQHEKDCRNQKINETAIKLQKGMS